MGWEKDSAWFDLEEKIFLNFMPGKENTQPGCPDWVVLQLVVRPYRGVTFSA